MSSSAFSVQQFSDSYPPGVEFTYWSKARNAVIYRILSQGHFNDERLIEVGCGVGVVVSYLRERGLDVQGIEANDCRVITSVVQHVRTRDFASNLPEDERKKFTVLLLLDVIEHVKDVTTFMAELLAAFPHVTHVLITVPARTEIWSEWDIYYGHQRRYSKESLISTLLACGLTTVRSGYFFHLLYLVAVGLNIARITRSTKVKAPRSGIHTVISSLLGWIFFIEFLLFPSGLYGSSLFALASVRRHSSIR